MDLFGKILVLANFALSLMMAAVGGAVLYYRVDWSDTPADAATGAPAGELVARIAEVKKLQALVTPADAAWRKARASLLAQEERRKGDRDLVRGRAGTSQDRRRLEDADSRGGFRQGRRPRPTRRTTVGRRWRRSPTVLARHFSRWFGIINNRAR